MAKLTEYPLATRFDDGDILIKDGVNGTKKIRVSDASKAMGSEVIKINEQPGENTKISITLTDEEYELALMEDLNNLVDPTLSEEGRAAESKVVGDLIEDLTGCRKIIFSDPSLKQYIATDGSTVQWNNPGVSSVNPFKWAVVECAPGDKFTISGYGGSTSRLWAFADSSRNILDPRAAINAEENELILTAPENAAYLILNDRSNKDSFVGVLPKNSIDELYRYDEQIAKYNTVNLIAYHKPKDMTANRAGVTFTCANDLETFTLNGTATSVGSYTRLMTNNESLEYLKAGETYDVIINRDCNAYAVFIFAKEGTEETDNVRFSKTGSITIPDDFLGCGVRIYAVNGTTYNNANISVKLIKRSADHVDIDILKKNLETVENKLANAEDPLQSLYSRHFYRIPLIESGPMTAYKVENGETVVAEDVSIQGTEMIECPKYIVFSSGSISLSERESIMAANKTPEASRTSGGVTTVRSDDYETFTLNGTASDSYTGYITLMTPGQSLAQLEPGKTYHLVIERDCNAVVRMYSGGWTAADVVQTFLDNADITIPASGFNGYGFRICALKSNVFENGKIRVRLLDTSIPSETRATNMYVYFYQKNGDTFVRRDDVLRYDASNGLVNYFNTGTLHNRVLEVPEGTYIQVNTDHSGYLAIYGWDGMHLGAEMCGLSFDLPGSAYNTGGTSILIPGTARLLFTKSFTFTEVRGAPTGFVNPASYGKMEKVFVSSPVDTNKRMCCALPDGYDYFIVGVNKLANSGSDLSLATVDAVYHGNLNDEIIAVCNTDVIAEPAGKAASVLETAEAITNVKWTCKKKTRGKADTYDFEKDVEYTSVPYVSAWMNPQSLGWHISKHTFLNAANDADSAFYNEHSTDEDGDQTSLSPGYGLVCTTFAELCNGWPYPQVTGELQKNPDNIVEVSDVPVPGAVMHNNGGHVILPEKIIDFDGINEVIVYEGVNPSSSRVARLSKRCEPDGHNATKKGFRNYDYLSDYVYAIHRKDAAGYPKTHYDIYSGCVINGSARPYRGDRSVVTNLTGVKINIKNSNATTLYLQKCTYAQGTRAWTPVPYVTGTFTVDSNAQRIAIPINSSTQVNVDVSLLEDGAFYGCYTDVDSKMEYFEYHSVTPGTYSKTENEGYTFSVNKFWYIAFATVTVATEENDDSFHVTIPYASNGDYRKYRQAMDPADNTKAVAFVKGTLGAYVIPLTQL